MVEWVRETVVMSMALSLVISNSVSIRQLAMVAQACSLNTPVVEASLGYVERPCL